MRTRTEDKFSVQELAKWGAKKVTLRASVDWESLLGNFAHLVTRYGNGDVYVRTSDGGSTWVGSVRVRICGGEWRTLRTTPYASPADAYEAAISCVSISLMYALEEQ